MKPVQIRNWIMVREWTCPCCGRKSEDRIKIPDKIEETYRDEYFCRICDHGHKTKRDAINCCPEWECGICGNLAWSYEVAEECCK